MKKETKEKWKRKLRSLLRALTNPHLLISLGIAWFITNGWSYVFFGVGLYLHIPWMYRIGAFWMSLLWIPGTPEKLVTFVIAIWLLKLLFPDDTRTLAMIRRKRRQVREATKLEFQRIRAKFGRKKKRKPPETPEPEDTETETESDNENKSE